jgi:hypothetical protein
MRKIDEIREELTEEFIKKELAIVASVELPTELQEWVKEYNRVGDRNEFLWKWLYVCFQEVHLPTISSEYEESLRRLKVVIALYVVLTDDAADQIKSKSLLDALTDIPFKQCNSQITDLSAGEKRYVELAKKAWEHVETVMKEYPRYKEFYEVFKFDFAQVNNSSRYGYLVNTNPFMINKREYLSYVSHNMIAMPCSVLDMMCSPSLELSEVNRIRDIILNAQTMARIGNCVSTWKRELKEGDFSNGTIAYAQDYGCVDQNDIIEGNVEEIIRIIESSQVEQLMFDDWERCYCEIEEKSKFISSMNALQFLKVLERLIKLHLMSAGFK